MPAPSTADYLSIPRKWPLVNRFQSRDIAIASNPGIFPIQRDARLINCYAELDPEDEEYWIYKRPGLSPTPLWTQPGNGMGCYTYNFPITAGKTNQLIWVNGLQVYFASIGFSVNNPGSLPGPGGVGAYPVSFETINSSPQTVVLQNGNGGAIFTPSTGAYTGIVDATFNSLSLVPGWAYLDTTLYVMDTKGNIYGTAGPDNAAVWSGTNVIRASSLADAGVAISKQLSYVIAFKQWSTQPFFDNGNPTGSPLSALPNAQIQYGCYNGYTVQKIDEILIWVSANQIPSAQVILMENLNPVIISTPAVERVLRSAVFLYGSGAVSNPGIFSWTTKHPGHRWYGLTFANLNITLVYDIDQKLWYIWSDPSGNYWSVASMSYFAPTATSVGLNICQHTTNGGIYVMDAGNYSDIGALFPVDIYTPNYTGGTQRSKQLNAMYFLSDKISGSYMLARYSDDDYTTWSNFRQIDLNDDRPLLDQDGSFYRRAYHFRHQLNTKFRIKSSDLQLALGTL